MQRGDRRGEAWRELGIDAAWIPPGVAVARLAAGDVALRLKDVNPDGLSITIAGHSVAVPAAASGIVKSHDRASRRMNMPVVMHTHTAAS